MKRIKYMMAALLFCACLASCGDWKFLEEHPKKIDATTFMRNAEEVQGQINSVYWHLRRDPGFGRYLSVLPDALADNAYGRGNYGTSFSEGLSPGAVGFVADSWAVLYRAIRISNQIVRAMPDAEMTSMEYGRLSGEVRFLRAFAYSYLVKYWGAVPFFDENNMDDFNKPRTPAGQIWQYVIDEAVYAAENLPAMASEAGRPTRWAALMLLAEASLWTGDYETAADALGKVVKAGNLSLVSVSAADDFDKVFGPSANDTPEEIFYIKYNRDEGATFPWMYLCKPNPVFDTGALGLYTDYEKNSFIREWDKSDLRYQYDLYVQNANATLNTQTKTGMICLKYRDSGTNGSSFSCDFPIYRYADALLYYAEAVCWRDGRPDAEAMECVNKVRRRAYGLNPDKVSPVDYSLSAYSSKDEFIGLVLKERGYETIFEGKRFCDLRRLGKLAEYALKAGRVASLEEVSEKALLWPIPSSEFNYNTALDPSKDQNPGY